MMLWKTREEAMAVAVSVAATAEAEVTVIDAVEDMGRGSGSW